MAALASNNMTLLDWASGMDPDGSVADVIELLAQTNEVLVDAVHKMGNLPTGHQTTVRTGLPTIYWRSLNEGIPSSKSKKAQVTEPCAIMETRSEVDIDLVSLEDNEAAFRLSEAQAFIEAMGQEWATTLFYGNPASDPKKFLGLAPRYSSTSAANGKNIILGGGADSGAPTQTSMWLLCWGDNTIFCPFPKGSKAGLLQEDLGRYTSQNVDGVAGYNMEVYGDRYQWKTGLVVRDWRYAVRIANIETATGDTNAIVDLNGTMAPATVTNLLHLMTIAIGQIPSLRMGRPVFYCNRMVFTGLMRLALEKSSAVLSIQSAITQFGTNESMLSFLGIPIRQVDAISTDEDVIS